MVPSHRRFGFAEAAALFPGDGIFGEVLPAAFGDIREQSRGRGDLGRPCNAGTIGGSCYIRRIEILVRLSR